MGTLTLAHFAANALLLLLGYYWLGVPESRGATLAWSLFLAVFMVVLGSGTYAASLAFFRPGENPRAVKAWKTGLRNTLPFLLALLVITVIYWLLAKWADYSSQPVFRIASYLTLKFRKPVRPASVGRFFAAGLWLVRWMVLPALFVPVLAAIASVGWPGYTAFGQRVGKRLYWIQAPILLYAAFGVPMLMLNWVPRVHSFGAEAASFTARAAIAYLLFGGAWLLLARVTSGGNPRATQPNTVVSP